MNHLVEVDYSDREGRSRSRERYTEPSYQIPQAENKPFHHAHKDSSDLLYRNLQKMQTPERETM